MSINKGKTPLTPSEIKKLAKKIVSENPTYIPDDPETVGSPDNLEDDNTEDEDDKTATKKPE